MRKILCLCLVLSVCLCLCSCKSSDYKNAMSLYEAGEYDEAMAAFEALDDYKDSAAKMEECNIEIQYQDAVALMEATQYEEAIAVFEVLDGYKDSVTLIEACNTAIMDGKYKDAVALMDTDLVLAFEALVALDGYKDSAEKADSIYEQYAMEKIEAANVGDYIPFGTYEQDNNHANGKEYVEWLVLEKKGNKILVISRYALDCQPYIAQDHLFKEDVSWNSYSFRKRLKDVSWKNCSLREWMNSTFINTAFSSSEQSRIAKKGQDEVFLLSLSEVYEYFDSNSARECKPTDFAVAQGVEVIESDSGICPWWLTGDLDWKELVAVRTDTSIYTWEWPVIINSIYTFPSSGIRPAMWISIES